MHDPVTYAVNSNTRSGFSDSMRLYRILTFVFTSIATGLAAAFILLLMKPGLLSDTHDDGLKLPKLSLHSNHGPVSYAEAVNRAAPAVVNVYATKITRQRRPLIQDPRLKRFFGDNLGVPQYQRENSLGSGVIIDSNGFILTNNHVIADASEIHVVLKDGRSLAARVVGTDPETELAVLQAAGGDLPVATLGHSSKLQVGDVVMAIGNPFGVGQTVTLGIVSATGRTELGITDIENFIQTDAAINPGNSGGALINAHGEVVGINTAIFSDSGGSHGIGFAIPVKLAREVMRQIAEHGRVIRGWIGISSQDLTLSLAESFGLREAHGILVSGVLTEGPADQAGLQPGDLILSIDDKPIASSNRALNYIAARQPGDEVEITFFRQGRNHVTRVRVAERPARD